MVLRIVLILLLCSCSAKYHLKQAKKHILKAEMLGEQWKADTVYKETPVYIPRTRTDSIVVTKPGDTVRIEKERLRIKLVKLPGDTVYVEGECVADTVEIRVPVEVNKTLPIQRGIPWWWIVVAMVIGFLLALIIRAVR